MSRFSSRTIRLLGDELAGNWRLATISDLFQDEGIACGSTTASTQDSGQRRTLMSQYLATLDLDAPSDVGKLVPVFNHVLDGMRERGDEDADTSMTKLTRSLRRDGFVVDEGHIAWTSSIVTNEALSSLPDASAIRDHLRRLGDSIEPDPRLAVSAAKALVESTAKLVLRELGVSHTSRIGVPGLVSMAQEALGLAAKDVTAPDAVGARTIKSILRSLSTLAQGVTELRNSVGVDHGRESVPEWVRPRHARLAAGAAQVWCQLMLETLDDPQAPWRLKSVPSRISPERSRP